MQLIMGLLIEMERLGNHVTAMDNQNSNMALDIICFATIFLYDVSLRQYVK